MNRIFHYGVAENTEKFMRRFLFCIFFVLFVSLWPIYSSAATQEEVFKSISDNVGSTTDPKKFFAFFAGAAGLVILIAVLSQRKKRQVMPKKLNHQGKLLKEVLAQIDLRPVELKQLKMLAEAQGVSSPLTLLLCPSVLAKAVKERTTKVDRKVLIGIAKKLG
jgi:hypothetical protein